MKKKKTEWQFHSMIEWALVTNRNRRIYVWYTQKRPSSHLSSRHIVILNVSCRINNKPKLLFTSHRQKILTKEMVKRFNSKYDFNTRFFRVFRNACVCVCALKRDSKMNRKFYYDIHLYCRAKIIQKTEPKKQVVSFFTAVIIVLTAAVVIDSTTQKKKIYIYIVE